MIFLDMALGIIIKKTGKADAWEKAMMHFYIPNVLRSKWGVKKTVIYKFCPH